MACESGCCIGLTTQKYNRKYPTMHNNSRSTHLSWTITWASCQILKIAGCACTGNAGNVFPAADFKGNRKLAIPACITARASRTCRDTCRDRLPAVAEKTFPAFPAHAHPQCYVSGKRPMALWHRHRRIYQSGQVSAWWCAISILTWRL